MVYMVVSVSCIPSPASRFSNRIASRVSRDIIHTMKTKYADEKADTSTLSAFRGDWLRHTLIQLIVPLLNVYLSRTVSALAGQL